MLLVIMLWNSEATQARASPSLVPTVSRSLAISSAGSRSCSTVISWPIWSCSAAISFGTRPMNWTTWFWISGTSSTKTQATAIRNTISTKALAEAAADAPALQPGDRRARER